jgi:hypothetical protein
MATRSGNQQMERTIMSAVNSPPAKVLRILMSSVLLSAVPAFASPFPISDAAYPLLLDRTQTNRQAFYIYQDADSGFNHGFPSGWFGAISKIHIDTACIDDPTAANGCSTNLNSLDRERGNVFRVSFDAFGAGEYAGVNIEEPEHWGETQTGVGYNLTGCTQLVVNVRVPTHGGLAVKLLPLGYDSGRFYRIPQSSNYSELRIPVPSSAPLTNVHVLMTVVSSVDLSPKGGTILIDNARFKPAPFSQTNSLGFPPRQ